MRPREEQVKRTKKRRPRVAVGKKEDRGRNQSAPREGGDQKRAAVEGRKSSSPMILGRKATAYSSKGVGFREGAKKPKIAKRKEGREKVKCGREVERVPASTTLYRRAGRRLWMLEKNLMRKKRR